MHVKKHLGFSGLRKTISKRLLQIEDFQKGEVEYTLHDCFMSAFAMMFFEHNFGHGKKNLSMMFFLLNLPAFFYSPDFGIDRCALSKMPGHIQLSQGILESVALHL